MSYSPSQIRAIGVTERVASVFSLLGCAFVICTFSFSARFRKPVNRLILYAVIGNVIYSISTLIATAGVDQGSDSPLCQTQAFLIQAFLPADALWNLSMALNVYVTVFKHYDSSQLRAREPYYHLVNYGIPIVVALVYCFVSTDTNGKVYGDAILWCWVTEKWDWLRILTCYGPAWLCIITSFTIYVLAGIEIRKKRKLLRSAGGRVSDHTNSRSTPTKTTEVQVVSELSDLGSPRVTSFQTANSNTARNSRITPDHEYSVTVSGGRAQFTKMPDVEANPSRARQQRKTAIEANRAAWRYTQCCLLFFASLLITWLPSSVNRVFALVWPTLTPPFGLSYTAALVLPLTGFWNSIIYVTTSWSACTALVHEDIVPFLRGRPAGDARAATFWGAPQRPVSHRPTPPSPHRRYSELERSDGSDERGRHSPYDDTAGVARAL